MYDPPEAECTPSQPMAQDEAMAQALESQAAEAKKASAFHALECGRQERIHRAAVAALNELRPEKNVQAPKDHGQRPSVESHF